LPIIVRQPDVRLGRLRLDLQRLEILIFLCDSPTLNPQLILVKIGHLSIQLLCAIIAVYLDLPVAVLVVGRVLAFLFGVIEAMASLLWKRVYRK